MSESLEPESAEQSPQGERDPDWDRSFSLKQLLWLMVILSVMLAIMRCFSPPVAAGLAGLAVLVGLAGMSLSDPPVIVWLAWWLLLALYLAAAAIAVATT